MPDSTITHPAVGKATFCPVCLNARFDSTPFFDWAGVSVVSTLAFLPRKSGTNTNEIVSPAEMHTTARIVGLDAAGREFQFGSGFFYQFLVSENDDHQVPAPITNNHVINGASKVGFVVYTPPTEEKPNGNTPMVSEKRKPLAEVADAGTLDIC